MSLKFSIINLRRSHFYSTKYSSKSLQRMNAHQFEPDISTAPEYWQDLLQSPTENLIGQQFRILKFIGRGGYGCVFLTEEINPEEDGFVGEKFAMKIVPFNDSDETDMKMLNREISFQALYRKESNGFLLVYQFVWTEIIADLPDVITDELKNMDNFSRSNKCACMIMEFCSREY